MDAVGYDEAVHYGGMVDNILRLYRILNRHVVLRNGAKETCINLSSFLSKSFKEEGIEVEVVNAAMERRKAQMIGDGYFCLGLAGRNVVYVINDESSVLRDNLSRFEVIEIDVEDSLNSMDY